MHLEAVVFEGGKRVVLSAGYEEVRQMPAMLFLGSCEVLELSTADDLLLLPLLLLRSELSQEPCSRRRNIR